MDIASVSTSLITPQNILILSLAGLGQSLVFSGLVVYTVNRITPALMGIPPQIASLVNAINAVKESVDDLKDETKTQFEGLNKRVDKVERVLERQSKAESK